MLELLRSLILRLFATTPGLQASVCPPTECPECPPVARPPRLMDFSEGNAPMPVTTDWSDLVSTEIVSPPPQSHVSFNHSADVSLNLFNTPGSNLVGTYAIERRLLVDGLEHALPEISINVSSLADGLNQIAKLTAGGKSVAVLVSANNPTISVKLQARVKPGCMGGIQSGVCTLQFVSLAG